MSHLNTEGSIRGGVADVAIRYHVNAQTDYRAVDGCYHREWATFWRTDGILAMSQHLANSERYSCRLGMDIVPRSYLPNL